MGNFNLSSFLGSAFTGTTSLLSGLFGAAQQARNIDKQIAAQREENERTRAYNLELARQQNAWNIEQWNRENAYNSPQQIMARLSDAGLNPDMIYSGGASNFSAASSPSLTAGAPATSADMSNLALKPTVGGVIQQSLQDSIIGAQAKLISSQSRKTDSERESVDINNQTLFDINRASLDKLLEDTKLTKEQRKKVVQEYENLKFQYDSIGEQINLIRAQVRNMDVSTFTNLLNSSVDSALKSTQIDLNKRELFEMKESWTERLRTYILTNDVMESDPKLLLSGLFSDPDFKQSVTDLLSRGADTALSVAEKIVRGFDLLGEVLDKFESFIEDPFKGLKKRLKSTFGVD